MDKLTDWNFWSGVIVTLIAGLIGAAIQYIIRHWFESKVDRVDLQCKLYSTSDLKLLNEIGSPIICCKIVSKGKRTAKISKTILSSSIPDSYILTLESPEKVPYENIDDDLFSEAEIHFELLPSSNPSHEHGYILERDDIAEFYFPIGIDLIPMILEAPSEDVKLEAVYFDGTKEILKRGFELQQFLDHACAHHSGIPINLKVDLKIGFSTSHNTALGFLIPENALIGIEERKLISESFNEDRMEKCMEIFREIWNNWSSSRVLHYVVVPSHPIDIKKPYLIKDVIFNIGVTNPVHTIKLIDLLVIFSMLGQSAAYHESIQDNEITSSTYSANFTIKTEFSNREVTALLEQIEISEPHEN